MSQDNVQVVQSMYAAFAKGDIPTVIAALDQQVEWWEAENFIYDDGNPYTGPDAVLNGVFADRSGVGRLCGISQRSAGRRRHRHWTWILQRVLPEKWETSTGAVRAPFYPSRWEGRKVSAVHGYRAVQTGHVGLVRLGDKNAGLYLLQNAA